MGFLVAFPLKNHQRLDPQKDAPHFGGSKESDPRMVFGVLERQSRGLTTDTPRQHRTATCLWLAGKVPVRFVFVVYLKCSKEVRCFLRANRHFCELRAVFGRATCPFGGPNSESWRFPTRPGRLLGLPCGARGSVLRRFSVVMCSHGKAREVFFGVCFCDRAQANAGNFQCRQKCSSRWHRNCGQH